MPYAENQPFEPTVPFMRPQDVVPPNLAGRLQIVTSTDPSSAVWQEAAAIEAQVFNECGYDTPEQLTAEYAPYVETSEMIGLLRKTDRDDPGVMIGASRVADPHPKEGLKTIHDIEIGRLKLDELGRSALKGVDLEHGTMSIDTISLDEKFRYGASAGYVGLLYAAQYVRAVNKGYKNIVATFDSGYWGGFQKRFSHFVVPLGPAVQYQGSPSVPALIDVTKASLNDFRPRRERKETADVVNAQQAGTPAEAA